jgi:hypothetical protein
MVKLNGKQDLKRPATITIDGRFRTLGYVTGDERKLCLDQQPVNSVADVAQVSLSAALQFADR